MDRVFERYAPKTKDGIALYVANTCIMAKNCKLITKSLSKITAQIEKRI
jgi:hypothetical protein